MLEEVAGGWIIGYILCWVNGKLFEGLEQRRGGQHFQGILLAAMWRRLLGYKSGDKKPEALQVREYGDFDERDSSGGGTIFRIYFEGETAKFCWWIGCRGEGNESRVTPHFLV